jgi:diguanylate cyclase (GGDEF)-like protein
MLPDSLTPRWLCAKDVPLSRQLEFSLPLLEIIPDCIILLDSSGRCQGFKNEYGGNAISLPASILGAPYTQALPPPLADAITNILSEETSDVSPASFSIRLETAAGATRYLDGRIALEKDGFAWIVLRTRSAYLPSAKADSSVINRIHALYNISQSLIEGNDWNVILQQAADSAVEALSADCVSLIIFNLEKQVVTDFFVSGPGKNKVIKVEFSELWDGLSGWVLREKLPALSPRNIPDPRESALVQSRRCETGCGDIIVVPILFAGSLLGTCTAINTPDAKEFTEEDVEILVTIARQTAITVTYKNSEDEIRRVNARLQAQNLKINIINTMIEEMQRFETEENVFRVLKQFLPQLFSGLSANLYLSEVNTAAMRAVVSIGDEPALTASIPPDLLPVAEPTGAAPGPFFDLKGSGGAKSIAFPINSISANSGLLVLASELITNDDKSMIHVLADSIGYALTNAHLRVSLRQEAIHDPLTGVFNRRYMEESLRRDLSRLRRNQQPLSIIMLDIDQFKRFNDSFGHLVGDRVLQEIGSTLCKCVRAEDIVCRYGGEEFIVLLPRADMSIALERAKMVAEKIRKISFTTTGSVLQSITVSMGISMFPKHGCEIDELLRAADTALYQAKHSGRDCIVLAP